MFTHLETALISLGEKIPLELFAFVASFVEEIIAPIPSPTVMLTTGALAHLQEYALLGVGFLVLLGALGKTLGGAVVYRISDKAEDLVVNRLGVFFGVTHAEIEGFGKRFSGSVKDYGIVVLLRALPFVPSVLISVGSGVLKIPMRIFIVGTFIGTLIRDGFYIMTGYVGITFVTELVHHFTGVETFIEYIVVIGIVGTLIFLFLRSREKKRKLTKDLLEE